MVEVYKTNVQTQEQARKIQSFLMTNLSHLKVNFDLDDCDKILRVKNIHPTETLVVVDYLFQFGFQCEILN